MYRKYRIGKCIARSVSQYESYRDQVYRYTPTWDVITNPIPSFNFVIIEKLTESLFLARSAALLRTGL